MKDKILILGGYGNFGKLISKSLARSNIDIIIAGRNIEKATKQKDHIINSHPNSNVEISIFDAEKEIDLQLAILSPKVVINTCGPFQETDYKIAESCIKHKIHYIDLSDGRDYVTGITELNTAAKHNNVQIVSGASTVPALSSAVLEHFKDDFSEIDSMKFGITPGAKAPRGLATTKAILGYTGRKLKPCIGQSKNRYGWQDMYKQNYPEIGNRWMANCDIPDLDLLPEKYGIKNIKFSAGMESKLLHFLIWLISWMVRIGLPIKLEKYSSFFLRVSKLFDFLGTDAGGMHVIIKGKGKNDNDLETKWFIIAKSGDGPNIPTIPSIILAKKLINNNYYESGAIPCVAMISLNEYINELNEFDVETYTL